MRKNKSYNIDSKYFSNVRVDNLFIGKRKIDCKICFSFKENMQYEFSVFDDFFRIYSVYLIINNFESNFFYSIWDYKEEMALEARGIRVNKEVLKDIYKIIKEEEKKDRDGWLKGYTISDQLVFRLIEIE